MKILVEIEVQPRDGWVPGIVDDFGGPVLIQHDYACPDDGLHHEEMDSVVAFQAADVFREFAERLEYASFEAWKVTAVTIADRITAP